MAKKVSRHEVLSVARKRPMREAKNFAKAVHGGKLDAEHSSRKAVKESPAARQARHEADHKIIAKASKAAAVAGNKALAKRLGIAIPAPAPTAPAKRTKTAPAPDPAPAPIAAPVAPPAPAVRHSVPIGVYLNGNRNTAICIKHTETGLWFLTMLSGQITLEHCSADKFQYEWRIPMPLYPLRRALRLYNESYLTRDEQCQKVMRVLLRDL